MSSVISGVPKDPQLDLVPGRDSVGVYRIDDHLTATCVVRDGRPVANITWFLNQEPLYEDGLGRPETYTMAKENVETKVQNYTRTLRAADNGKFLRCVAYHPAYPNGYKETSRQLHIECESENDAQCVLHLFNFTQKQ